MASFFPAMERNQRSPGDGSDERLRAAGAHSRLSPGPPVYGSGSLWSGSQFRRAKSSSVPILLSAHWGLLPLKFESIAALPHTAWCLPTCLVRPSSIAQLPRFCQSRRCPYSADTLNFRLVGPKARDKKNARSCIRSRRTQMPNPQEGVPRKRGSRGRRL